MVIFYRKENKIAAAGGASCLFDVFSLLQYAAHKSPLAGFSQNK